MREAVNFFSKEETKLVKRKTKNQILLPKKVLLLLPSLPPNQTPLPSLSLPNHKQKLRNQKQVLCLMMTKTYQALKILTKKGKPYSTITQTIPQICQTTTLHFKFLPLNPLMWNPLFSLHLLPFLLQRNTQLRRVRTSPKNLFSLVQPERDLLKLLHLLEP